MHRGQSGPTRRSRCSSSAASARRPGWAVSRRRRLAWDWPTRPSGEQVHALERQLGARLVEPHSAGCRLTDDGRVLAEMADPLVAEHRFPETALSGSPGPGAARLTVAATQRTLIEDLPRSIEAFERRHPNVQLCFRKRTIEGVIVAVESGQADLGLTPFPGRSAQPLARLRAGL